MKLFVTFGPQHHHVVADKVIDCDCVVLIEGPDYDSCRMHVAAYFQNDYGVLHPGVEPDLSSYPRGIIVLPGTPVLGRPRELDKPHRQQVLLQPEDLEKAKALGDGNVSAGIRKALAQAVLA